MRILARDPTKLSYSIRFWAVFKYVGKFCFISACLALVPLIGSLIWQEYSMSLRYLIVAAIFGVLGLISFKIPDPKSLQDNEAFSIIASTFLLSSVVMIIPMMGAGLGAMDAWFEAVSGITTTGLSVSYGQENLKTFYFSRSFLQWYGGIGIVVMSLGLAMQPSVVARSLGKGLTGKKELSTSTREFAKQMSIVYGIISVLCLVILWIFAPTFYDALIHMLAAVSTGGFSNTSESLARFSMSFQVTAIVFCFLSSISFPFYWSLKTRKKTDNFLGDIQFIGLIISCFFVSLLLYFFFTPREGGSLIEIFLNAFSAQTTAGFSTVSMEHQSAASKLVLMASMAIGGSTQSTAGGFKILRLCIFLRSIQLIFLKTSLPKHAVTFEQLGGEKLTSSEKETCFSIILLFFFTVFVSWMIFVASGYEPLNSLFEVVSATGTVGLSTGITSMDLPTHLKAVLCIDMFLGRLEFVTLITLFLPRTLFGRRMHS